MRIYYTLGSQTFAMTVAHVNAFDIEAVMSEDGTTFLYERWVIDVLAILNVSSPGNAIIFPPALTGRPGQTHLAVRHGLLQPRGRVRIVMDDNVTLLDAPQPPYQVDAHNGPTPLRFNVISVSGTETVYVRWAVEVCVNECHVKNPVLAHRWRMMEDVDRHGFSTRIVEGQVVFRTDEMYLRGIGPDTLQSLFIHKCPDGMRRMGIQRWVTEDGSELRYRVVDKVVSHSLTEQAAKVASHVEVEHWLSVQQPEVYDIKHQELFEAADTAFGLGLNMYGLKALINPTRLPSMIAGDGSIRDLVLGYPQSVDRLVVKGWGTPKSQRKELEKLVVSVGLSRMTQVLRKRGVTPSYGAQEWTLYNREAGDEAKYVEFSIVVKRGQTDKTAASLLLSPSDLTADTETITDLQGRTIITPDPVQCPGLPNENNTRGSWIGTLAAQWLQAPCAAPMAPLSYFRRELVTRNVPPPAQPEPGPATGVQVGPATTMHAGGPSTLTPQNSGGAVDPGPLPPP